MTQDFRKYQKPEETPDAAKPTAAAPNLTKPDPTSPRQEAKPKYWSENQSLDDVRRIYVKTNYHKFQETFEKCDDKNGLQSGFSVYAFFFGVFWFFYRKMYREGLLIIGAGLVLTTIGHSLNLNEGVLNMVVMGGMLALAGLSKGLYWMSVNRQISQAMVLFPTKPDRALEWLDKTGGVNYVVVPIAIAFITLMIYSTIRVAIQ